AVPHRVRWWDNYWSPIQNQGDCPVFPKGHFDRTWSTKLPYFQCWEEGEWSGDPSQGSDRAAAPPHWGRMNIGPGTAPGPRHLPTLILIVSYSINFSRSGGPDLSGARWLIVKIKHNHSCPIPISKIWTRDRRPVFKKAHGFLGPWALELNQTNLKPNEELRPFINWSPEVPHCPR